MGILHINHACSHLQNAAKARLGLTSIPNNKYNLRFVLALHRAGFLASVARAGPSPPLSLAPYGGGGGIGDGVELTINEEEEPVTSANVATRRLWLGLKYWNNEPVMSRLRGYSKPSRLVTISHAELERVVRGFPSGPVKGLNLGECLFVSTDRGILEAREALVKKAGGLVLCSVS